MKDWALPDPHEQGIEMVRKVRDDISHRVERLLDGMGCAARQ